MHSKQLLYRVLAFLGAVVWCSSTNALQTVRNDNSLIYYHGRWDASPGSWWASTGFKLYIHGLSSLTLNLGPHTAAPASLGVSLDYQPFVTVNVSQGANVIPLGSLSAGDEPSVVRINVEGWQNNRIILQTIELNDGAILFPYRPSKLAFQFIGDSLSAGQYLDQGVDQAWPFLTAEFLKAEHYINAQPGAALTDIVSYGNQHGVSYQYFKTEDTGYYDDPDHNYTTPWNFKRDVPQPTHIVIHIGANDAGQNVSAATFVQVYESFFDRLRTLYPIQPVFVFSPWGWPSASGYTSQYYQGSYQQIVDARHSVGDKNVFLVNTTGWVTWADVFPDNQHPTVAGHQKIAGLFESWLKIWGLTGETGWPTSV